MPVLLKSNRKASSRTQIDIESVQDGIICLSGTRYCLSLQASSINFELMSEAEQDVLIDTYQSFLNSLGSSIQILLRVREMDLDKYIDDLKEKQAAEPIRAYREQIGSYTEFVKKLVKQNKILSRQFYIVLSLTPKAKTDFNLVKEQLLLNADIVEKGLAKLGMRLRLLSSLEILDIFYGIYNYSQSKTQPLTEQTMKLLKETLI